LGREAYFINSWTGYWLSCQAGLVVVSGGGADINRVGISRAKRIQLFHGIPLKKILLDDHITRFHDQNTIYRIAKVIWHAIFPFTHTMTRWDAIISTSPLASARFLSAFGVDKNKVFVTGYPRNDILLKQNPEPVSIIDDLRESANATKFICYVPTHRGAGKSDINTLFSTLNIEDLETCLEDHSAVMLIKMHYFHQHSNPLFRIHHKKTRIHWLSEDEASDINDLFPFINLMITDYSSAYIDFLLLDRPIIFAPFDLEQYLAQDREFYEDYDTSIPGPKCKNWGEVIVALDDILSGNDSYADMRKQTIEKYHSFVDSKSCQRVFELALALVNS
jgi:CDP-glycerol glycerophosphotransferase (TagB/SpsB family)